jgi:hypothetical protein
MLAGNGYFLEEAGLCGNSLVTNDDQMRARRMVDAAMGS